MKVDEVSEIVFGGMGCLALFSFICLWVATWITHVIVCIQTSQWILLLIGILFPPIGWVHGFFYWFGFFH